MRWLITNSLIRIYTVSDSVLDFTLKSLFEAVDMSKFKDGRVHLRNSGVKGLIHLKDFAAILQRETTFAYRKLPQYFQNWKISSQILYFKSSTHWEGRQVFLYQSYFPWTCILSSSKTAVNVLLCVG